MSEVWSPFVEPDVVRLPLSRPGQYIDVKKELNADEANGILATIVKTMHPGEKAEIDPKKVATTKMLAYLVGWSFVDKAGKPVPFSEAALKNLNKHTFGEISRLIDTHDEASEQSREEIKNAQAGETSSSPVSPSVDSTDVVTVTS